MDKVIKRFENETIFEAPNTQSYIFHEDVNSQGNSMKDCQNMCSNHGICRAYTCYCQPEYSGLDCSQLKEVDLVDGMPFHKAVYYFYGALIAGLLIGIILVRYTLKKADQQEFMKFRRGEEYD